MAALRAPRRRSRPTCAPATRRCSAATADDVAVTTGTSYGLGCVLAGMDIGPGDEIVTSDNEHPGLLGPLIAARHRGATVRAVPFAELANAVRATTTLVAASHVNWITGEVAPADLAEVPGAGDPRRRAGRGRRAGRRQGARLRGLRRRGPEVAVRRGRDRAAVACDPEFGERVRTIAPGYMAFEDATRGLESTFRAGGRRFDAPLAARGGRVLARRLPDARRGRLRRALIERAADLADAFAARAGEAPATRSRRAGAARWWPSSTPSPRRRASGSRRPASPCATCPGTPYLRASVGAWNDESDLERLLAALSEGRLRLLRLELRLGPGLPGGDQGPRADARGPRDPRGLRRRVGRPDGRAGRRDARGRRRGRRRDPAAARGPRDRPPAA